MSFAGGNRKWQLLTLTAFMVTMIVITINYKDQFVQHAVQFLPSAGHMEITNMDSGSESSCEGQGTSLRRKSGGIAHYSDRFYEKFKSLVERKAAGDDTEVIQIVRDIMDPPSLSRTLKLAHPARHTPQSRYIHTILQKKRKGFFVECGANDGERASNTLYLEKQFGWSGLLVEVDPYFYTQILGKGRKSWSINACLSPTSYVTELIFIPHIHGSGRVSSSVKSSAQKRTVTPCFPLESMLLALNTSRVNYFSLDVEGLEAPILRNFPFDRITVDTLSVEYSHGEGKQALKAILNDRYNLSKNIDSNDFAHSVFVKDFIFERKDLNP